MRGKLDVNTLVKIVLLLVAVWLALSILGEFIDIVFLGPLGDLLGLVVLLLLVLWLLGKL